jgi:hypothetical protein
MRSLVLLAIAALPLAACEGNVKDGETGTSVTIDAKGNSGEDVAITADGDTGRVAVKVPGFEGKMNLPKFMLDNSNFDLDGVKLYPGSKVGSVNVNADSGAGDAAKVAITFTSPADPAKVADYLQKAFAEKKIAVTSNGTALSGTTTDGNAFSIALEPGAGGTAGRINIDTK